MPGAQPFSLHLHYSDDFITLRVPADTVKAARLWLMPRRVPKSRQPRKNFPSIGFALIVKCQVPADAEMASGDTPSIRQTSGRVPTRIH